MTGLPPLPAVVYDEVSDYVGWLRDRKVMAAAWKQDGYPIEDIGMALGVGRQRAYQLVERGRHILAKRAKMMEMRNEWLVTRNLGRPLDMGGPRNRWLEFKIGDPL